MKNLFYPSGRRGCIDKSCSWYYCLSLRGTAMYITGDGWVILLVGMFTIIAMFITVLAMFVAKERRK